MPLPQTELGGQNAAGVQALSFASRENHAGPSHATGSPDPQTEPAGQSPSSGSGAIDEAPFSDEQLEMPMNTKRQRALRSARLWKIWWSF
jgi:hypothetical protein